MSTSPSPLDAEGNRILINVGGKRHETHVLTLRNIPDTRLAWLAEAHMRSDQQDGTPHGEYFFDRHPDIFGVILNYYRTGRLHSPRDICGPLFEEELQFWGIEEKDMEACCWPYYTQHRDAEKNMDDFVGPADESDDGEEPNSLHGDFKNVGNCWERYRPRVWAILDDASSSRKSKVYAYASVFIIIASVIAMCIASVGEMRKNIYLILADYFFCAWFTLELVVRLIFCPSKPFFFKEMLNWIDLISVLPFYGELLLGKKSPLGFLRVFRLIRLFRAFRYFTFTSGLQIIVKSLKASSRELFLLVIILLLPVAIFSSILYEIENGDPEQPNFKNIPETFWWAIITMTTVGYGDMTPLSILGRIVGGICALCGVLIVALPVSVIGNNFNTYYAHAQARLSLPKKKRRLIMEGEMRQLALLQGKSCSSIDTDTYPDIKKCYSEQTTRVDEETTRNYRRYHGRFRNTMFAGGDVYIGSLKHHGKGSEEIASVEKDVAILAAQNLVNTVRQSEEHIEEDTKRQIVFNSSSNNRKASTAKCHRKDLNRSKSKSSNELKNSGSENEATRMQKFKEFKSRVMPEGNVKNTRHAVDVVPRDLPAINDYRLNRLESRTKLEHPAERSHEEERTKTENGVFKSGRRKYRSAHSTNEHVAT